MPAEEQGIADVMNLLEAERNASDGGVVEMRKQLAVLVLTGKAKEAIGVALTHEEFRCLTDKDVQQKVRNLWP